MKNKQAFTLIELLIVIAIIAVLAIIVVINLANAQVKARDARRKADVKTLSDAIQLRYLEVGNYPGTDGWIDWNPTTPSSSGSIYKALVTPPAPEEQYISVLPNDPKTGSPANTYYLYYLKNYTSYGCPDLGNKKYAIYTKLENVPSADESTMSDAFDQCVAVDSRSAGYNFRAGN